jgi:F-type H+-transporting ATPase subunit b
MMELLATDQKLWIAISFFIFVGIAYKLAGKAISRGLDNKIEEIKTEIENAERLRVEAQELLAQYQRKQRDAEKEAAEMIEHAKQQAEQIKINAEKELAESMDRREDQLAERLKRIEENAIAEIQSHAADLAVTASQEMIVKTLDEKLNASLNEGTIKNIAKQLN